MWELRPATPSHSLPPGLGEKLTLLILRTETQLLQTQPLVPDVGREPRESDRGVPGSEGPTAGCASVPTA